MCSCSVGQPRDVVDMASAGIADHGPEVLLFALVVVGEHRVEVPERLGECRRSSMIARREPLQRIGEPAQVAADRPVDQAVHRLALQ